MMMVGGILGVLFVSLVRRVMVEDPSLPFPESVAAAEIHKAGQRGAEAARYLFWNIGVGAVVQLLGDIQAVRHRQRLRDSDRRAGPAAACAWVRAAAPILSRPARFDVPGPTVSPAYMGVGYVIGPELAALQFSGSVLAWGLLVPLLMYFLGPRLQELSPAGSRRSRMGRRRPQPCGATSSGRLPWAGCWWARLTRCSAWARS